MIWILAVSVFLPSFRAVSLQAPKSGFHLHPSSLHYALCLRVILTRLVLHYALCLHVASTRLGLHYALWLRVVLTRLVLHYALCLRVASTRLGLHYALFPLFPPVSSSAEP